jgi:PhnB protein
MSIESVNWLAVLAAAVSTFILGGLWYSPALFGRSWMAECGFTDADLQKGSTLKIFGFSFLFSLLMAANLALFLADPKTTAAWGATAGFLAGFGWVALGLGVISLFERKSWKYIFINGGYMTVAFIVMGLILGAWQSKSSAAPSSTPAAAVQPAAGKVKPIPKGYHSVTPYMVVRDAAKAIDFYKQAFGTTEISRMPGPDGKIVHAELQIGDSRIMLTEENPSEGERSPQMLNGTPVNIFLYVPDVDAVHQQAVRAGAKSITPPTNMFWGDRYSELTDPFGHHWSVATHVEEVGPEELVKRFEALSSQAPKK